MKITIDSRAALWYRGSGMGTYSYQLMRNLYLLDRKNKYEFILPESLGFAVTDPVNTSLFQSLAYTKPLFWEALLEEPVKVTACDVYHLPNNGIGFPELKKFPTVVTIHDLIPYVLPETVGKGYLTIFLREMPEIVEKCDHIIAVSKHTKQDLIRILKVPEAKISVIYEAAEDIYKPLDKQLTKAYLQRKYKINKPYVLYLGGFSPRKNVRGLVSAFKAVCADTADIQLLVAGRETPNLQALQEHIAKLSLTNKVRFLGFVPMQDLPYLYNGAALFVYPSLYEGFGLPPLEAMACGTPTLVSDCSSLPEIVGTGAKLVTVEETQALAAAMHEILHSESLAHELSLNGINQAHQYSWAKTAVKTLKVYEKCGSST